MFYATEIITFIGASIFLLLVPGPAVIYVVARSLEQGRNAGLVSACGTAVGGLFHVFAAVVGVSALIMTSATLFSIFKYAGATYLIYLGIMKLLEKPSKEESTVPRRSLRRLFLDGVAIETFNPKVAAFFLSFLPQFVHPERGNASMQIFILGIIFCLLALLSDSVLAFVADRAGKRLIKLTTSNQGFLNKFTGYVYILLGALALTVSEKSLKSVKS